MKRRLKLGISIAAIGLLIGTIVWQARTVSQFKSSAMRFVAAEAIGFVAIPNIARFFDNGIPPLNEILGAIADQPSPDFIKAMMPRPIGLPAQCITLAKSADLAANGIVPEGSFSVALLDSGIRAALKLSSDGSGLLFLSDLLFPSYVQLSYPADQSGDGNDHSTYKFTLSVQSKHVDFCPEREWHQNSASASEFVIEGRADTISLPMRLRSSALTATTSPTIDVTCMVSRGTESAQPCGCDVTEQGLGSVETRHGRQTGCGQDAFAKRTKDLATWSTELSKGHTVMIGDQYVAEIDGFHVIESPLPGVKKPAKYQMSTPTASIVSDDTLLSQFTTIAAPDKDDATTVLAGVRPDSIVWVIGTHGLPMYLLTPIGIHFQGAKIAVNVLSNLEPQDSAIVQTIATTSTSEASSRGWSNWRKALGGRLSDSSLKLYARFLRSYFTDIDNDIATYSPLAQVAMDIMEQGAGSIVIAVNQFYSSPNVARLAIAVPDIDSEIAGSMVTRSRRLSIERQARFVSEKAGELAQRRGAGPRNLDQAVNGLYCSSSLWRLESIGLRRTMRPVVPAADDTSDADDTQSAGQEPAAVKPKPLVAINEQAFAAESTSWSETEMGFLFQRILPPDDPNVVVWGNAYVNGTGLVQKDEAEVKPKADEFLDYLHEFQSNLAANPNDLRAVLNVMADKLLNFATLLESRRSFARQIGLVVDMKSIIAASNVDDALTKVADLLGKLKNHADLALAGPEEIKAFCEAAKGEPPPQSPMAIYDRRTGVLFVVDDTKIISSLTASSPQRDADGKLLVGLETPELAKLLAGNKVITEDDAKLLVGFPFARAELVLNGREAGTGIAAQLSLSKTDKK